MPFQQRKNVLFIATSFPKDSSDWKSVFIKQLLDSLSEIDWLQYHYWGPFGELPDKCSYMCSGNEKSWFDSIMKKGGVIHLIRQKKFFSFAILTRLFWYLRRVYQTEEVADIIHVNWLQNVLPLASSSNKPLVVSILGSDYGLLDLPLMTELIRRKLSGRRCILAPNAVWMQEKLKDKFGDIAEIVYVPLGLNDSWFACNSKRDNTERTNWLCVARLTKKKIGPLFEWGEKCFSRDSRYRLHLFGPMQEQLNIPDWTQYHGPTDPYALCTRWFPSAAGLISLSQHTEGRPQIMLEAMAAHVPVLASDILAHRDFIIHKENGLLVDSPHSLLDAIEWLNNCENHKCITHNAHTWVKKEVGTWSACAKRYADIYSNLLMVGE